MRAAAVSGLPGWAGALQGIAYWIGWNHTRYPHWSLTEGALVGELQRLIAGNILSNQMLCAEVDVKDLCSLHPGELDGSDQFGTGRVDMVIVRKGKNKSEKIFDVHKNALAVIEVKRSENSWTEIKNDIDRLAFLSQHLGDKVRFFVIVTSEAKSVRAQFAKKDRARKGWQSTDQAEYRVRRLYRAQSALCRSKSPHCACLVEVRRGSSLK
jgi:hypothetical protein